MFLFKYIYIYLRERERAIKIPHVGRESGRERAGEAGSLLSKGPDVGLNPRTLRS